MTDWLDTFIVRMTRPVSRALASPRLARILGEAGTLREQLAELEPNEDKLEAMITGALAEALEIIGVRASKYAASFRRARTPAEADRPPES